MLRSIRKIFGFSLQAQDGHIGHVIDFYFDDEKWTIRYLVADTGGLITGKQVLISPASFLGKPKWKEKEFPLVLTKRMIEESPSIANDLPVSRQKELELAVYYDWPQYWETLPEAGMPPLFPTSNGLLRESLPPPEEPAGHDVHLRSAKEVFKYHIAAKDGEIGHAEDIIVDEETWVIRYVVIDTRNWLPGKEVLIPPDHIMRIDWDISELEVDLTKRQIQESPAYSEDKTIDQQYEEKLNNYFNSVS
jgi:hypothetical protein